MAKLKKEKALSGKKQIVSWIVDSIKTSREYKWDYQFLLSLLERICGMAAGYSDDFVEDNLCDYFNGKKTKKEILGLFGVR